MYNCTLSSDLDNPLSRAWYLLLFGIEVVKLFSLSFRVPIRHFRITWFPEQIIKRLRLGFSVHIRQFLTACFPVEIIKSFCLSFITNVWCGGYILTLVRLKSFASEGQEGIFKLQDPSEVPSVFSEKWREVIHVSLSLTRLRFAAASSPCRSMALLRRAFALSALSYANFEFLSIYSLFPRFSVGIQLTLGLSQYMAGLPRSKWQLQHSFTLYDIFVFHITSTNRRNPPLWPFVVSSSACLPRFLMT